MKRFSSNNSFNSCYHNLFHKVGIIVISYIFLFFFRATVVTMVVYASASAIGLEPLNKLLGE